MPSMVEGARRRSPLRLAALATSPVNGGGTTGGLALSDYERRSATHSHSASGQISTSRKLSRNTASW